MTTSEILIPIFVVLIIGVMLPLPHGVRSALILALVVLSVLTFIGGSMHYLMGMF